MEIIKNEKTGANTYDVEFKVSAEQFEEEIQKAYLKKRNTISVQGFRKGKAPRKMIEKLYGEGVFFEDAVNGMYQRAVADAIDELKIDVVDMPKIEVLEVKKEDGVSFKAEFTVKPEVNISDYKGIKMKREAKTISDEDVKAELDKLLDKNARIIDVTDRAVVNGDSVNFDFEGFCDGVAFDGGKAEKFDLEIGGGKFIPGFEEQIVGKKIGEDFDVNVTFPENYNAENLAGKAATFKCKIHEIKGKELPTADDEFAKDVSEFDTLDELKADLKKKLEEEAAKQEQATFENELSETVAGMLQAEVPEVMYEHRIDDMVRDWEYRNRYMGIKLEDYLKYTGTTIEQFRENFKKPAEIQVKLRLALEKIVELENITASDEDIEAQYKSLAEQHNMDIDRVKGIISVESLKTDVEVEKAFELIKENVKVTKPRAKKAAEDKADDAE